MKSPREILLQRHHHAAPDLDAVRRRTIDSLGVGSSPAQSHAQSRQSLSESISELIHSFRWHLAGLTAVWLTILGLNLTGAPDSPRLEAKTASASPRALCVALLEHRRQLEELTESPPPPAELPAPPPRRSELQTPFAIG
jgi:hypothetical protein